MEKIFAIRREVSNKKIDQKDRVLAILYGTSKPIPLTVGKKDFLKIYKKVGSSLIIELNVDQKKYLVLIHAVQKDVISEEITHIDFYQPKLKEKITIQVPIVFEGEAPAVKEFDGTFNSNIKEIEIKAFPLDFPQDIKVDISVLKTLDDQITVGDLKVSDKLEILLDKNFVVASVLPPEDVDTELEKEIGDVEKVEVSDSKKAKDDNDNDNDNDDDNDL